MPEQKPNVQYCACFACVWSVPRQDCGYVYIRPTQPRIVCWLVCKTTYVCNFEMVKYYRTAGRDGKRYPEKYQFDFTRINSPPFAVTDPEN